MTFSFLADAKQRTVKNALCKATQVALRGQLLGSRVTEQNTES